MRTTLRNRLLPAFLAVGLVAPAVATAAPTPGGAGGAGGAVAPEGSVVLTAGAHALAGRPARVRGFVARGDAGRTVRVERFDAATGTWVTEGTALAATDGAFAVRWRSARSGRFSLRAVVDHGGDASVAAASEEMAVTVYEPATATWYGPGFYGRRTACGQTLTRRLLGVAHRRLPCGTPVAIRHRGRNVVVPVVDRGPFGTDAEWDLTVAAARALGFTHTGAIGALPQR